MSRFFVVTITAEPILFSYDVELTDEAASRLALQSDLGRVVRVIAVIAGLPSALDLLYDRTDAQETNENPGKSRGEAMTDDSYPGVFVWPRPH